MDRPILFSGPMVEAILDGRKTQTRRVIKKQPLDILPCKGDKAGVIWASLDGHEPQSHGSIFGCRYGVAGDRLWVRETFAYLEDDNGMGGVCYKAGGMWTGLRWRPSIHMPRRFSRLTLEVVRVRAERLQRISNKDARAEGVADWEGDEPGDFRSSFRELWNDINDARGFGWDVNPWVWVVEFNRVG